MAFPARFLPACALLLPCLLAGCANQRTPEEMKDSLVFGYADTFSTFDPARQIHAQESVISLQVLEPLLAWNNEVELEPLLATAWETPDGCLTWHFTLRENVVFHDGDPFDAHAVKKHFDRILDPATAATRRSLIGDVVSVDAAGEFLVVFTLEEPNCVFPERLTSAFAAIPSPSSIDRHTNPDPARRVDMGRHPAGTGPFRFVDWEPDVSIRLARNADYWNGEEIHLDRLEFRPVRENTTRLILLEQGTLDMASISFAQVNVARTSGAVSLQTSPHLSIVYIGFNTQKPPFNDRRVRQAANYAVNQEEMVEYMFFGVGDPSIGPIPPVLPDFNPEVRRYPFDPGRARELLAEAGHGGGVTVSLWTQEEGTYRIAADAVVEQLRQVGIRVEMNILDNAVYWSRFDEYKTRDGREYPLKEGVWDIYIGGWTGGATAHGFLEPLFSSTSYSNTSFYHSGEVDELLSRFKTLVDPMDRRRVYHRLQEIIVEDAPWIFAFNRQVSIGMQDRVKGFRINPSGRLSFHGVTVD